MHKKSIYFLLLAVIAMIVIGVVMLFSTSAYAKDSHGDPVYFLKRQCIWLCVGICVCVIVSLVDYHFWERTWLIWFSLATILLALCFVPHIGLKINGARRWIGLGSIRFQPSDFAKLSSMIFLAWWLSKYEGELKNGLLKGFTHGFLYPLLILGIPLAFIAAEIDMGTTALIAGTALVLMFIAGTGLIFLLPIAGLGVSATIFIGMHLKGRSERILAFMDPSRFKEGAGLQQYQALLAFGSGGVEGLGLGNGRQKISFLPFAHTDFIFPMIGEELGLLCTLLVIACFMTFIVCGAIIAVRSRDRFGALLGLGIVVLISLQAALNIGVTTSLLPNKGLPLPFISYGGSNLLFCLVGIGILINIYRQGLAGKPNKAVVQFNTRVNRRI